MCRQNILFLKLNLCLGGFEFFRLKVPQSPLPRPWCPSMTIVISVALTSLR